MTYRIPNEQLKYDQGSKEYTDLEILMDKAKNVEEDIKKLCHKLAKTWKRHPEAACNILFIAIKADGYISLFAKDGKEYIMQYTYIKQE